MVMEVSEKHILHDRHTLGLLDIVVQICCGYMSQNSAVAHNLG